MSFDSDQISVSDSAIVELYEFLTPQTTYYRTTYHDDYLLSGHTYIAIPGMRAAIPIESPGNARAVSVELPVSDKVVFDNIVGVPPVPRTSILVTVIRLQLLSGASQIWWQGPVRGVSMTKNGRAARFLVPDGVEDALRSELPRVRAQRKCNHALYDTMCTVVEATYTHATTVSSLSGNDVTVATLADATLNYYKDGYLIFNGERRSIVAQSGAGNKTLTLDAQHRGILGGSSVSVVAGCDHNVTTCASAKFNNAINFGGHPGLPKSNPHVVRYVP